MAAGSSGMSRTPSQESERTQSQDGDAAQKKAPHWRLRQTNVTVNGSHAGLAREMWVSRSSQIPAWQCPLLVCAGGWACDMQCRGAGGQWSRTMKASCLTVPLGSPHPAVSPYLPNRSLERTCVCL